MSQAPELPQGTESGVQDAGIKGSRAAKTVIDWNPIEQAITKEGLSYAEASAKFGVKEHTIRMRAQRKQWHITRRAVKNVVSKQVEKQLARVAGEITQSAIEEHKQRIFDIGSQSVAKFRPKAPRNFKELKTADDITRRSAGIDDSDDKSVSLILVNEAIEGHEPVERATLQPDNTDDGNQGIRDAGQQEPKESNAPEESNAPLMLHDSPTA